MGFHWGFPGAWDFGLAWVDGCFEVRMHVFHKGGWGIIVDGWCIVCRRYIGFEGL